MSTVVENIKTGERHIIDDADIIPTGCRYVGPTGIVAMKTKVASEPKERKKYPIATGVIDYFPDALIAVAHVSYQGNQQHHPDKPLHWDRSKSSDEADALMRHFIERGTPDEDGHRHSAKLAWRALALLQKEIESEQV